MLRNPIRTRRPAWTACLSLLLGSTASAQTASIQGLGPLPPGFVATAATAVSGNGQVVVGWMLQSGGQQEAFRWTAATGIVPMGGLPAGYSRTRATGVSHDGSVIAGDAVGPTNTHVFVWTPGSGMQDRGMPTFPSYSEVYVTRVSNDGSTVCGFTTAPGTGSTFGFAHAVGSASWELNQGLLGGGQNAVLQDLSGDGSVIVGADLSAFSSPNFEAFRSVAGVGNVPLGGVDPSAANSTAYGVSTDGLVTVGIVRQGANFYPFRAVGGGNMQILPGGTGGAYAVNGDGRVIGMGLGFTNQACIWTAAGGTRRLRDVLIEQGADVSGWESLASVVDISEDGRVLVGQGFRVGEPGMSQAFVATLVSDPCPARWQEVTTTPGPSARSGHALAWDAARGRLVLFGGDTGSLNGETWEFDGATWALKNLSGPSPRVHANMVYMPEAGGCVLFGGRGPGTTMYDDTWVWNGQTWEFKSVGTRPPARSVHGMAYDSDRGRLVMFGGVNSSINALGDTWEFTGTQWIQRATGGPTAREWAGMAYDPRVGHRKTVLFGGSGTGGTAFNDTWEWDGPSGTWTFTNAPGPSARSNKNLAFDAARGKIVLFSGYGSGTFRDDTWEYDGTAWTQRVTLRPRARYSHPLVYDPVGQRVITFGGEVSSGRVGEVWSWDGAAWRVLWSSEKPYQRAAGAMVSLPSAGGLLLTGGSGDTPATTTLGDTWVWINGQWGLMSVIVNGNSRYATAPTLDESQSPAVPVTLGGINASGTALNDVQTLNPSGLFFSHPLGFPRHSLAAVSDAPRGRILVYGGRNAGTRYGDMYQVTGAGTFGFATLQICGSCGPGIRESHAMALDTARGKVVLFGGYNGSAFVNDTWEFDVVTNTWAQAAVSSSPGPRAGARMVYDSARGRCVLFGGTNGSTRLNDVWEYDGVQWLLTSNDEGPADRLDAMWARDPASGELILFGGADGPTAFQDTWRYRGPATITASVSTEPPDLNRAYAGSDLTLAVSVTASDAGSLEYSWSYAPSEFVDGYPPSALRDGDRGGRVSGALTAALTIDGLTSPDTGSYTLRVKRGCDVLLTRTYQVGVKCNVADISHLGGGDPTEFPPDGQLTLDDLIVMVNNYSGADGCPGDAPCNEADITGIGGFPEPPDGQLTVDDLIEFVNSYSAGC